ncbi:MAG: hypothetical protein M0C28_17845 [Candidatus Moduliflexus flocculans]|nr:hypothetical protein [Candidatus Moduliflexus flocculans]
MDMWKPFRNVTNERAPAGGDPVRQVPRHAPPGRGARRGAQERVRAGSSGQDRRYIKGQKYTLLSHRENLHPGWPARR